MKKAKFIVTALTAVLLVSSLTGCGGGETESPVYFSFSAALESGVTSVRMGETAQIEIVENAASEELVDPDNPIVHNYTFSSSNTAVLTVDETGLVTPVSVGTAKVTVHETVEDVKTILTLDVFDKDPMTGISSYKNADIAVRTEILGKLEKYAMDNHLTGVSLFENGGYVMYNPRIQKGTENYIPGYGFGILGEGNITEDLPSESKAEWKRYYHSGTSSDPHTINHLDAQGNDVSDLTSYISASYWGAKMNAEKDGYDWYGSLCLDERPIPYTIKDEVQVTSIASLTAEQAEAVTEKLPDGSSSNLWKIYVRTDGVTYRTNSTKTIYGKDISAFDGREVTLDDYLYAYQLLLTGGFDLFRGAEKAADDSYGFTGAADYHTDTATATEIDEEKFASVGVKAGTDARGDYLLVETLGTFTPFMAMYGLNSSLVQPVPRDFILAIGNGNEKTGVENYGAFIDSVGATPVDTILSLGSMILEYWEEDKVIAFERNDTWFETVADPTRNRIPGVKITVYPGAKDDTTLIFKEFLEGNLDAAGIPTIEYLKKYRGDPRTTQTTGDAVFKLNMNSCTEERWVELFGEEGEITRTPQSNYWDVKPWMSNDNFLNGINTAIDRKTFAENRGMIPSNNYFSSNYLMDPENGIAYNNTDAHKEAMSNYYPETFGFNQSAAKIYFRRAVEELVEAGDLELGTKSKPTVISFDIWWMYQSDIKDYGDEISGYIEKAFNSSYVCGKKVKLDINNFAVTDPMDVYYEHLMLGQFDLGFGSISGNSFDPLNFMEVLKSDNSSSFTLNWGPDTSVCDPNLIFDGRAWSYDALWAAGDSFAYTFEGEVAPTHGVTGFGGYKFNEDGSLSIAVSVYCVNDGSLLTTLLYAVDLYGANDTAAHSDAVALRVLYNGADALGSGNSSWTVTPTETPNVSIVVITFSAEMVQLFVDLLGQNPATWMFDFYFYVNVDGIYGPALQFAGSYYMDGVTIPVEPTPADPAP